MAKSSLTVSGQAEFYRAFCDGETRYYPVAGNEDSRSSAFDFHNDLSDPVKVEGFAVYDTNVSTEYAVGLYGNKSEAEEHVTVEPETASTEAVEDQPTQEDAGITGEDESNSAGDAPVDPSNAAEPVTGKRGKA